MMKVPQSHIYRENVINYAMYMNNTGLCICKANIFETDYFVNIFNNVGFVRLVLFRIVSMKVLGLEACERIPSHTPHICTVFSIN